MNDRKTPPKEVRAYEIANKDRCYVRLFGKYKSLCTAGKATNIFYFKPVNKPSPGNWFTKHPVGHDTLQSRIKHMCEASGIRGKTSHTLRATATTRLFQANVEEQLICNVTGRRSKAVRTCKRPSDRRQEDVSNILTKRVCAQRPRIQLKRNWFRKPALRILPVFRVSFLAKNLTYNFNFN